MTNLKAEIRRARWLYWRLRLSVRLTSLACWIGQSAKPCRYICPKCREEFKDEKPSKPLVLVVTCPHCSYQSIVGGSVERPYIVNPDRLQDGVELCSYGCHYEEPYGFVPMAGCPVHD